MEDVVTTQRAVDWDRLLGDLAWLLGEPDPANHGMRAPVSTQRLADHLGFPRGTVRRWLDGAEPRHIDGEVLIAKWIVLSGKRREFVPLTVVSFSAAKVTT